MNGFNSRIARFSRVLITPPDDGANETLLPLATVKNHLRVDYADDDLLITSMRDAAVQLLDVASRGWLGRALSLQTWELRLDAFPLCDDGSSASIPLPSPPLRSVTSIKYDDSSGTEQTLDPSSYRIAGGDVAAIATVYGVAWPSARYAEESVRIRFACGYGDDEGATPLPAAIISALLLMIGDLYEFRETATAEARITPAIIPMSTTVDALLAPYRAYWR